MAGHLITSCTEPKLIYKLKIEVMNKKLSKEKSARTKADSGTKDEEMQVSPAIAKPIVVGSQSPHSETDSEISNKGDICFASVLLPDKSHFNYEIQKPESWMHNYINQN